MFSRLRFSLITALALFQSAAHATIIGDTVNGSFNSIYNDWSIDSVSTTVSVGGPDFQIFISSGRGIDIDIEEGFIDFTYNGVSNISLSSCNLNCSITISNIDDLITNVTLFEFDANNSVNFGGNTATFTDHSISLFADQVWDASDRVRIEFESSVRIPEPTTIALIGCGLLAFGCNRKSRNSRRRR